MHISNLENEFFQFAKRNSIQTNKTKANPNHYVSEGTFLAIKNFPFAVYSVQILELALRGLDHGFWAHLHVKSIYAPWDRIFMHQMSI